MEMLWKHTKTKGLYRILNFAVDEANLTPLVVYQAVKEGDDIEKPSGPIWVRPAARFFDGRFRQVFYDDEEEVEIAGVADRTAGSGPSGKGGIPRAKVGLGRPPLGT